MKYLYLSLFTLLSFSSFSQCINKFPYKEDFEKFRKTQTTSSCDPSIIGDTANRWVQDPNDNGDWRADTSGTPSTGTGPGATDTTSGNGTGKDFNPGSINGVYLYTEASSSVGCTNAVINLLSPCFDFSASGKFYRLQFAYHMLGSGMGDLFIDVFDKGVWNNAVWSIGGNQGESWLRADVPLGKFNGNNVQIRIRSVMGDNFLSDMAIDDIQITEYFPPNYDAELVSVLRTVDNYVFYTSRQGEDFNLVSSVKNNGAKEITGVKVVADCGNYTDTLYLDTIPAFSAKAGTFSKTIAPTDTATQRRVYFNVLLNEKDTNYSNNLRDIGSGLVDSTLARDAGTNTGALGFNTGAGEIGQMFHLKNKDTLTSITFGLINPTVGDSVKVRLYEFDPSSGPTNLLATSVSVKLIAGANWYTLRFPCEQFLDTGNYFVAVEQLVANNNMALGYTTSFYTPGTVFFGGGGTWTEAGSSNFFVAMLLRMNFGKQIPPQLKITSNSDTICQGESMLLRASGATTYDWSPASLVPNPKAVQNSVSPITTTTFSITGTNSCKLSSTINYTLNVKKSPLGTVTPDSTICFGKSITLAATSSSNYAWTGGPSNANYTVSPTSFTAYEVIFDSTNGCKTKKNVTISVDRPTITKSNDTTICEGQKVNLFASGLASYKWVGGPSTQNFEVSPAATRAYIISGNNTRGCQALDSIITTVLPSPVIGITNDTSICFGNKITLSASGGVGYQWLSGPPTSQWTFLPFANEHKYVTVVGSNGCSKTDSVYVGVASFPIINAGNDTTICEGQSVVLDAQSSEIVNYKWTHGPTAKTTTVSPTSKTSYKVRGTNATGCFTEDSLTITVNPLAKADFATSVASKNVTLTNNSTNNNDVFWDLGDGKTSSNTSLVHTYSADGTYKIKLVVSNGCGKDSMEKTVVINTAGLNDAVSLGIQIYPQPVKNQLSIVFPAHLNGQWNIVMVDATGKTIQSAIVDADMNQTTVLNTEGLASGLYQLQLINNGQTYFYKIVK
jgi:PKD repeat protein